MRAAARLAVVWALILGQWLPLLSQQVVATSRSRDWSLIGGGLLMAGAGQWLQSRQSLESDFALDESVVPAFDRWALHRRSRTASTISDAGMISAVLISGALTATLHEESQRRRDVLVWGEAVLFTNGLTYLVKNLVRRPRPEAYDKAARGEALTHYDFRSFFSGHTATAFAAISAGLSLWAMDHSDADLADWPVLTGLTLASTVGVCRILGGHHFPSDVFTGALTGMAIGWVVPRIRTQSASGKNPPPVVLSLRIPL